MAWCLVYILGLYMYSFIAAPSKGRIVNYRDQWTEGDLAYTYTMRIGKYTHGVMKTDENNSRTHQLYNLVSGACNDNRILFFLHHHAPHGTRHSSPKLQEPCSQPIGIPTDCIPIFTCHSDSGHNKLFFCSRSTKDYKGWLVPGTLRGFWNMNILSICFSFESKEMETIVFLWLQVP